ncbi:MAG TPA: T9SS type A sorting domain-containing protein [Ignavibacteria bacterium]|nr:T9SS type A sorting domain-containing protein [Ignavibacteria bacterium]
MKKLIFLVFPILLIAALITVSTNKSNIKIKQSGALQALDIWAMQRAYPDKLIPEQGYYDAFEYSKIMNADLDNTGLDDWREIGPHNIGGRTLALAINPLRPNTIYAGSASGGLWVSYTGGVGVVAWKRIATGHPVLGVGAIAMHSSDTNTMYIGTGEVYGYQNSIGGLTIRTTRGSYGIGILKTTNNGVTWTKSLDWSYNQRRGVQVVRINPLRPNTVYAGTSEGTYRTYNGGTNWTLIDTTKMVTDIVINHSDTNYVYLACGNLNSPGVGLYRSTNAGGSFQKMTSGLPTTWGGKAIFSIFKANPAIIYVSIGNGSATGAGTWLCKTTNRGDTWTIVNTGDYATYQGWYSHFVGVHPTDQNLVLAAGIDIYKSTNGGSTIQIRSDWASWDFGRTPIGGPEGPPQYSHADHHCIEYHPSNPNIIYFGNDGGVFRSTDGGETFEGCNGSYQTTQFYNGFSSANMDSLFSMGGMQDNATAIYDGQLAWIRCIGGDGTMTAVNFQNNNIVYGASQNLNVLRSTNKGQSFNGVSIPGSGNSTGFLAPYILAPSNSNVMYAGRNIIYKSTNGGTSSLTATNGGVAPDGSNPSLSMAISFTDPNVLFVATAPVSSRAKIFRTTNGGTTFVNVTGTLPDRYPTDLAVDPQNDQIVYAVFSGFGTGHIFKSTNRGDSWADITNNLPDLPTTAIIVDHQYSNILYAGNDLGVYSSTNGGTTWSPFMTGMTESSVIYDLSIVRPNRKLRAVTHGNGNYERSMLDGTVSVGNENELVKSYALYQNYPNPFNPETTIKFDIPKSSFVNISVYDVTGKLIKQLLNDNRTSGSYEVKFNAFNLASGVYYYKITAGDFSEVKKMMLVK